jgi:hypothetical protein
VFEVKKEIPVKQARTATPASGGSKNPPKVLLKVLAIVVAIYVGVFLFSMITDDKKNGASSDETMASYEKRGVEAITYIRMKVRGKTEVPTNGRWDYEPNVMYCPADDYACTEVTYTVSIMSAADVKELEARWLVAFNKKTGEPAFIRTLNPFSRAGFIYLNAASSGDIYIFQH